MRYKDIIELAELRDYARSMNQRAHKLQIEGEITAEALRAVIMESGGKCAWCDRDLVNHDFEIDHIVALIKGGAHDDDNLAMTCIRCNRKKSEKAPTKFALEIVAETGIQTTLTKYILDQHDIKPQQQTSLFDLDDDQPTASNWVYTPPDA